MRAITEAHETLTAVVVAAVLVLSVGTQAVRRLQATVAQAQQITTTGAAQLTQAAAVVAAQVRQLRDRAVRAVAVQVQEQERRQQGQPILVAVVAVAVLAGPAAQEK